MMTTKKEDLLTSIRVYYLTLLKALLSTTMTGVLNIVVELAGEGYIALAVAISDM